MGRVNVVIIATRYRLDGSGFESRGGETDFLFSTPIHTCPIAQPKYCKNVVGAF